ncbi:MAG: type II toxin-antitoxin system HicA family toxin [Anaerolineae bacterium]|nr:type II toxin-antitoxin system HicA family toxin [Anaerolineae bacterium]
MPKLRRLNGLDLVRIFEQFGFVVIRIRGSHHVLRRSSKVLHADGTVHEETQTVNIPVHGAKPLGSGLLKRIYRESSLYLSEDDLRTHFYSD